MLTSDSQHPPRSGHAVYLGEGFTYIRRLRSYFGFKILNFNIFFLGGGGGFQKNEYYCGMKILWIFLGAITKLDYI